MRDSDHPKLDAPSEAVRVRRARLLGLSALGVLALLVAVGGWRVWAQTEDARATLARIEEVPTVRTVLVKPSDTARQLALSGTMQPFDTATIYARATGYVAKWNADFGTHVKAGDVLAEIAAPDLDQQLVQARAQLVQAQAQAKLLQATNDRTKVLVGQGWQTKQQGDTDRLNLQAGIAGVGAAEANLARLERLAQFERVTAPFDGVITNRQIDVGSLVAADTNSGTALFSIDRSDVLRVQVYVPQDAVFALHQGGVARISVPEMPDRSFEGHISRIAGALDAASRTQLTQVDIDNRDGALRAGLYCTVTFQLPRDHPAITLPSQALVFNQHGLSVAVVSDGKVRIQPVELAQDDGATVDIKTGISPGDQVILSPPVNLADGMKVNTQAG
jgi:RND family efflux transporter MFP subunit